MKNRRSGKNVFFGSRRWSLLGYVVLGVNICSSCWGQSRDESPWISATDLTVEGQAWTTTESPFDRLPISAKPVVRPAVWGLSRHSAGICVRFQSDAESIWARWKLTSSRLAMPHMTATGVSGIDLYARDAEGRWRWLAAGQPKSQENEVRLASGMTARMREYMLYLPLYNGVSSLNLRVPKSAKLEPGPARPEAKRRPIVFYGTSITQGGCASRPGMVHTAILGRWLDRPVINLGFSGNGKMESEVGQFIQQIDAAAFVIDCSPNMVATQITDRTGPLVKQLRQKHPTTPILLVEDRNYSNGLLVDQNRQRNETNQAALRAAFEELAGSDDNLHYLTGPQLLGDDNEGTVDGSHPTDLGFWRQAREFQKALTPLLLH